LRRAKKISRYILLSVVVLYMYIALDVSTFKPFEADIETVSKNFNVYSGAVHIHTVRSDGSGTVRDVAHAAKQAGLDFVILSDHNASTDAREDAGYYDGVLVLVGSEVSVPEAHILYVPHPDSSFHSIEYLKENIYEVDDQALVMIAHPFLPKRPLKKDTTHLTDGIELINADEIWRKTSRWRLFEAFVTYPLMPYSMNTMVMTPEENMQLWRAKAAEGSTLKYIGSVDAHASVKITKERVWRFPSYYRLFKIVQTHVVARQPLIGDYRHDARIVYDALKNGNAYISYENLGGTGGFEFFATAADTLYPSGSIVQTGKEIQLHLRVPEGQQVRVYIKSPDGAVVEADGNEVQYENPEPGVYYAEVSQVRRILPFGKKVEFPWIIANPIIIQ